MKTVELEDKAFSIFSGNSNLILAKKLCLHLGVKLGNAKVGQFSDGEIHVEIEDNVRGVDAFVVQSMCRPVNDNLLELLLLVDALKRASAKSITAVVPYYGYARQDKKLASRAPISAKLVADLLTISGVDRVITMDLHASQIQGFFDIPIENMSALPVFYEYISSNFTNSNMVVVSPDFGGVERARTTAWHFGCGLAIIDKRRFAPNEATVMTVVGDVSGKTVIIQDDMVDTAGTLVEVSKALVRRGASSIHVCCTHPVLSGHALDKIMNSSISTMVVTDTVPISRSALDCDKIEVLSIANLLGEAVFRSFTGESVTSLFV